MNERFTPPLDQLFRLGNVQSKDDWQNYLALGITKEHVTDLIGIATDLDLNWADEDSPEVWAPLHAWRALAQLRASEAIQPVLDLVDELADDEWFNNDFVKLMASFGPPAVAPLTTYLSNADLSDWTVGAANVTEGLTQIGRKYPEMRGRITDTLASSLQHYPDNAPGINSWLIDGLLVLRAKKTLPLIAAAFDAEAVDDMAFGWGYVQKELQLPPNAQPSDYLEDGD